jgi:hypothetical protein
MHPCLRERKHDTTLNEEQDWDTPLPPSVVWLEIPVSSYVKYSQVQYKIISLCDSNCIITKQINKSILICITFTKLS